MQECEGFMSKGISGSGVGFDAASMGRLGGRGPVPIHNPPSHQLKSLALKVSQARTSLTVDVKYNVCCHIFMTTHK